MEPLCEIQGFLRRQNIGGCRVKWITNSAYTKGGIYWLKVTSVRDIDRIVAGTEPFLMTSIRKNQYGRYRERKQEAWNKVTFEHNAVNTQDPSRWIDWKVVAAWIDAEGNLNARTEARTKVEGIIASAYRKRKGYL